MRSVWKFPIGGVTADPTTIKAPGLISPCFVAVQDDTNAWAGGQVCVWAEVDTSQPERSCVVTVHGTGHPINNDENYIGTLMDGPFVWHFFATDPLEVTPWEKQ